MAFVKRRITVVFNKDNGDKFASTDATTLTVSGARVKCQIVNPGGAQMGTANMRIYGLTLSQMNDLSAINSLIVLQKITILVYASDDQGNMNLIFEGYVIVSQIDLNSAPEAALYVVAQSGYIYTLQITKVVRSYPLNSSAKMVLGELATAMNLTLEFTGPDVTLPEPYFYGSDRDQLLRCVFMAGLNWFIDVGSSGQGGVQGILAVWPLKGVRASGLLPEISPETGIIGYPSYSGIGIAVATVFNLNIKLGQIVVVKSSLKFANGQWGVYNIRHEIESELPGGKWMTQFDGSPYDSTNP